MTKHEYRNMCYKIARQTGVYLVVKQHRTSKLQSGRLMRVYEINENEILLDIFFKGGCEVYNFDQILFYELKGCQKEWPKYIEELKDLFGNAKTKKYKYRKKKK